MCHVDTLLGFFLLNKFIESFECFVEDSQGSLKSFSVFLLIIKIALDSLACTFICAVLPRKTRLAVTNCHRCPPAVLSHCSVVSVWLLLDLQCRDRTDTYMSCAALSELCHRPDSSICSQLCLTPVLAGFSAFSRCPLWHGLCFLRCGSTWQT